MSCLASLRSFFSRASPPPPRYKNSSTQTVGVEFGSRIITMGGKRVKLQIWDTAGQERFRAVTRSYYRGAAGAIIVYDISNRDSFSHVQQWLNDAQQLAGEHICMMVVGNKADLQGEREVTFLEASRVAQEAEVLFLETSALTGEGVEDIFMRVARGIHARALRMPLSQHSAFLYLTFSLHHSQEWTMACSTRPGPPVAYSPLSPLQGVQVCCLASSAAFLWPSYCTLAVSLVNSAPGDDSAQKSACGC